MCSPGQVNEFHACHGLFTFIIVFRRARFLPSPESGGIYSMSYHHPISASVFSFVSFLQIYAPTSLKDFFCPSIQAARCNHFLVHLSVTQITFFEEGIFRSFSICNFFFHFLVTSSFLGTHIFPRKYFPLHRSFKLCPV